MKAVILAAGYATRLYPLTLNTPKALLDIGGKTIIGRLLEQLDKIKIIEYVYIVTNHKFFSHFQEWGRQKKYHFELKIIDDGSTTPENRLGAVADLYFVLQTVSINNDILVCASDNIFEFDLNEFVEAFLKNPTPHACVRELYDAEALRRTGVVVLDEDKRVIKFQEKPQIPASNWACPPIYIFPKSIIPKIKEFLQTSQNKDSPGSFIQWLVNFETIYAFIIRGKVYDIGNIESLHRVREIYTK